MRFKSILKTLFIALIVCGINSCKENKTGKEIKIVNEPIVVSFDNELAFTEFREMNLDSTYTNLLNPRNVTESEYKDVTESWSKFHKKVSKFIKEENFKWEVNDSTISVANRIYFDKKGTVDYYSFRILNPSISADKRAEYEKLLQKFSKEIKLDLKRNEQYAQCGKIKYLNY